MKGGLPDNVLDVEPLPSETIEKGWGIREGKVPPEFSSPRRGQPAIPGIENVIALTEVEP